MLLKVLYPALILFEQSNCIDWINFCYMPSLTKIVLVIDLC